MCAIIMNSFFNYGIGDEFMSFIYPYILGFVTGKPLYKYSWNNPLMHGNTDRYLTIVKHNKNCLLNAWDVPDSKVHVANMGPTWVLLAPDGPHVGPMNLAIRGTTGFLFSCDQAALWTVFSVRPSVCLSHLFDYVPIISSWNFQEILPMTKVTSMQKVKVKGQGHSPT